MRVCSNKAPIIQGLNILLYSRSARYLKVQQMSTNITKHHSKIDSGAASAATSHPLRLSDILRIRGYRPLHADWGQRRATAWLERVHWNSTCHYPSPNIKAPITIVWLIYPEAHACDLGLILGLRTNLHRFLVRFTRRRSHWPFWGIDWASKHWCKMLWWSYITQVLKPQEKQIDLRFTDVLFNQFHTFWWIYGFGLWLIPNNQNHICHYAKCFITRISIVNCVAWHVCLSMIIPFCHFQNETWICVLMKLDSLSPIDNLWDMHA